MAQTSVKTAAQSLQIWTALVYLLQESKGPKAVISIKDLNATFQPEKIGHPNGLQITYQDGDHTRNLYVYHERSEVSRRDRL